MFLPVEFHDSEGPYIEHLNVVHITRISFINPRNPDAGAKIHLRTGEVLSTKMPFDQLSQAIDEAWESAAALVLSTLLSEKAKLIPVGTQQPEESSEFPEDFQA